MSSETRRERKVVTVVFCDLVGFTSRAEKLATRRRRSRRVAHNGAAAAAGRRPESEVELEKALSFYRSVGATLFVKRGEQLLAKSA